MSQTNNNSTIEINAIKAFNDNYIWAIEGNDNNLALVDPGDAAVCITYIKENNLILSDILITHHHKDHVGGIAELIAFAETQQWNVTVYGPKHENIKQLDVTLVQDDIVNLAKLCCQFNVIDLPGHTMGHIAYFSSIGSISSSSSENSESTADERNILFCGDTLFSGGCGRLFEGTPAQMLASLNKLAKLPSDTFVYCAHEYTQANLAFALTVEPSNTDLQNYSKKVNELRSNNESTIPTQIGTEKLINPFLRSHQQTIKLAAQAHSGEIQVTDVDVFTTIRRWKDNF